MGWLGSAGNKYLVPQLALLKWFTQSSGCSGVSQLY